MTMGMRTYVSLLAGAMAAGAIACGGGSSSGTGPVTAAIPSTSTPAAAGATIAGTVQTTGVAGAALGGVHALSAGLRVSVVGTSLSTTTDDAGRFVLGGVPAGHVQLRFEGPGVDARLDLDGLQIGQTLTVTVRVSGSSASKVDDGGREVELKGKVDSVGSNSITVAGKTFKVDASTRLLGQEGATVPLSSFKPGDLVEVEASAQTDGSLLAKKVQLDDGEDDGEDNGKSGQEVAFSGTISSLSPTLMIAGRTVTTDGETKYLGRKDETLPKADVLKIGNKVEVDGPAQSGTSVLAKKIKLED
jgi:hypothetical protein